MSLVKLRAPAQYLPGTLFEVGSRNYHRVGADGTVLVDTDLASLPAFPAGFEPVEEPVALAKFRAPAHCTPGSLFELNGGIHLVLRDGTTVIEVEAANIGQLTAQGFEGLETSGASTQRPMATWPGQIFNDQTIGLQLRRSASDDCWLCPSGARVADVEREQPQAAEPLIEQAAEPEATTPAAATV